MMRHRMPTTAPDSSAGKNHSARISPRGRRSLPRLSSASAARNETMMVIAVTPMAKVTVASIISPKPSISCRCM